MYSEKAASRAVKFIKELKHTKGRWAGVPFNLLPWQENEIVRPLFGTLKDNGLRQYTSAYVEVPKKNGKTEIAAAIALYLLFADKEPGAEIYSAACDKEQAGIVFRVAAAMVRQCPALLERCKIIDSQKTIVVPSTDSFYRALSADVPTKHGLNPHGVIFDELHAQPNRDLWEVLTEGSMDARTQPLLFAITTAGFDRHSICWERHVYAERVLKGEVQDPTLLPVIYGLDSEEDWEKEENWYKVNPSLGQIIDIEKVRTAYREAKETPAKQNAFRRLRLNQWTSQETRWIPMDKWDACAGERLPLERFRGRPCWGGLDLSSTTDITALGLAFPPWEEDPLWRVLMEFWIPEERMRERSKRDGVPYEQWWKAGLITATPGNVIDYAFIRKRMNELGDILAFQEVGFDPWNATQISLDLAGDGFTMVKIIQGFKSLSPPTKEVEKLVLGQELSHGGNPVLRWMVENVMVIQDAAGNVKPAKNKSREKIDGVVALITAMARASCREQVADPYADGIIVG